MRGAMRLLQSCEYFEARRKISVVFVTVGEFVANNIRDDAGLAEAHILFEFPFLLLRLQDGGWDRCRAEFAEFMRIGDRAMGRK